MFCPIFSFVFCILKTTQPFINIKGYLESDKLASLAHKANIVQVFETHVIKLITYYFLGILQLLVPGEREENTYESAEMSPP